MSIGKNTEKYYFIGTSGSGKTYNAIQFQFNVKFKDSYNPFIDDDLSPEIEEFLWHEEDEIEHDYQFSTISLGWLEYLIEENKLPEGTFVLCSYSKRAINEKWESDLSVCVKKMKKMNKKIISLEEMDKILLGYKIQSIESKTLDIC